MRMNDNEEGGVDMCKKLVSLVCVLMLASASYGVPLGDFGGGDDGRGDWTFRGDDWGVTDSSSAIGATNGATSLKIVAPSGWWVGQAASYDLTGGGQMDLVTSKTATAVTLDVTRFDSDWSTAWWIAPSQLRMVVDLKVENGDGDVAYPACVDSMLGANWFPTEQNGRTDPANGWPDPIVAGPSGVAVTYTWSLQPVFDLIAVWAANGWTVTGMDFALNIQSQGYNSPVIYYVDNAQLVPEPATIALLGLGGLAMIRRKR
jgi:hypothetical protein